MIFWITFSAWQRGVELLDQRRLLDHVCVVSGHGREKWGDDGDRIQLWQAEHDYVQKRFIEKFSKYAEMWEKSEAGKLYVQYRDAMKYTL
jgi:hypothetical protein